MENQNNQTAAAIATVASAVDWEALGLNHQAIIEAGNQGKLGGPLTKWLVEQGWLTPAQVVKVEVLPKDAELPDGLISVNRTTPLQHPEWVKEALCDESVGPAEIDPSKAELWLHNNQKTGVTTGLVIHDHLVKNKMIESCYGLRELLAIQAKGIAYFRKHWKGKAVFGWKGTARRHGGRFVAPCLYDGGGWVVLGWHWLDNDWNSNNPALRVATHFISPEPLLWLGSFGLGDGGSGCESSRNNFRGTLGARRRESEQNRQQAVYAYPIKLFRLLLTSPSQPLA